MMKTVSPTQLLSGNQKGYIKDLLCTATKILKNIVLIQIQTHMFNSKILAFIYIACSLFWNVDLMNAQIFLTNNA